MSSRRSVLPVALCALALVSPGALAQADAGIPDWARGIVKDPDSPEAKAYSEQQARRAKVEQELKRLRLEYFRQARPR